MDLGEKRQVLSELRFGDRVAENETDQLQQYFVETDQWRRVYRGEIDVVYGPKGSGKSALYTLLCSKESEFFDRKILLVPAEAVRGSTVFKELVTSPPPSEASFIALWKLYCLVLVGAALRSFGLSSPEAKSVVLALEEARLLGQKADLYGLFKAARKYIYDLIGKEARSVEWEFSIDPESALPVVKRKTEFKEENEAKKLAALPADEMLRVADSALQKESFSIWLLFDRLDVAFSESRDLERNALRALFRVYRDCQALRAVTLKLFVRDDIWRRITAGGFAEASHITRTTEITWESRGLQNLVARRLLWNRKFIEGLGVDPAAIIADHEKQIALFYRIVPEQIDTGKNPKTFEWMINRTTDATTKPAPREIIHLLDCAREAQIKLIEHGDAHLPDDLFFERAVFKDALGDVSKVRLEQTLLAEHPELTPYVKKLEGEKAEQSSESLIAIWKCSREKAVEVASQLTEAGFFEVRGETASPTYWVPFLYRPSLKLIQGKADE